MTSSDWVGAARAWISGDPDPVTVSELTALIDSGNAAELRERMERPLVFGTAGLRGIVGAGPACMNLAVVLRTTRALGEYLLATDPDAKALPVVIGFDARLTSRTFADAAASVLAALGIPVRKFDEAVPTPLVAYAVGQLGCSAGIVITASHNPPAYNGYKLYARNGIQIVPPVDEDIERRIHAIGPASAIPTAPESPLVTSAPPSLREGYLAAIDALRPRRTADRGIDIVYTPLHGVGGKWALEALRRAGFDRVTAVPEQMDPDGTFPTVRFPNPEETEALALAVDLAKQRGAALVLANDPDADRLAACVPTAAGRWQPLSGNQIGVLLADFLLERFHPANALVVSSIVSTPMIDDVSRAHGAHSERTLTGFKWICTAAAELRRSRGMHFAFGFEEAIGYSPGGPVHDKDGISAALVFAELAAQCRAEGTTVLERLEGLYAKHGLWVSAQKSAVRPGVDGVAEIDRAMAQIAGSPPSDIAGHAVRSCTDYRVGAAARPPWLGAAPMIELSLGEAGRVLVRPSGTEPKVKVYVDLRKRVAADRVREEEQGLREEAGKIGAAVLEAMGF